MEAVFIKALNMSISTTDAMIGLRDMSRRTIMPKAAASKAQEKKARMTHDRPRSI